MRRQAWHFALFGSLMLLLLARHVDTVILGQPEAFQIRHPHQVLWPLLAGWLNHPWVVSVLLVALALPALWLHLGSTLAASLLLLSVVKLPLFSHVSANPNGDLLHNCLVVLTLIAIKEWKPWAIGLCAFLALVSHERVLFVFPALVLWCVYNRKPWWALIPAVVGWALFKNGYYLVWPAEGRDIGFMEQWRRLVDDQPLDAYTGSRWDNIVSRDNIVWNGLYYVAPLVLAFVHRPLAWFGIALFLGSLAQILIAEDVHRLTSYLWLGAVVMAMERIRYALSFMGLAFASVYVRHLERLLT